MRSLVRASRHKQASLWIDEPCSGVGHATTRDQQAVIIIDGDQAAVVHPVHGAGECEAVSDTIRPTMRHWADVGGLVPPIGRHR